RLKFTSAFRNCMLRKSFFSFVFIFSAWLSAAAESSSLPFVSPMFSDNMVLQRGKPNSILGWSNPGDAIQIEIAGHVARATTDEGGRWQVKIDPPPAGGPYTVKIDGSQHVELHEVLVGDVWLCGGQSNMELPLNRTRNGAEEIAAATRPEIRLFKVQSHAAYSPAAVPKGQWKICSPQTIAE